LTDQWLATPIRVLMGFYFYPRGGSAYVARYLCRYLPATSVQTRLVTGSLRSAHDFTEAGVFYRACADVWAVDYTPAVQAWHEGDDPLVATPPLHASYEDRPDVPDRVFGAMAPSVREHQVAFWQKTLLEAGSGEADVIHLHHLTPQLEGAIATGRPVVVHLHGTDLKFLSRCREGTQPWPHAQQWIPYFRRLLRHVARVVTVSPGDAEVAAELLDRSPESITVIPNGVDVDEFDRTALNPAQRRELWRRWLVEEPRGWDESGVIGSVRCTEADLDRLLPIDGSRPIVLCVARFLDFKRLPHLLESWAALRDRVGGTLVVWGGFPGECEGPHPVTVARDLDLDDVVFTGFRGHEDLRLAFNMTDLLVNAAKHEPFGQLLVEAMACGLPVVAAASGGPLVFVRPTGEDRNSWLFDPRSDTGLGEAMLQALADPDELRLRAANAYHQVRAELSWTAISQEFARLYQGLMHEHSPPPRNTQN
jgi:glycosyltransferase involved in cell wall biosynthesis